MQKFWLVTVFFLLVYYLNEGEGIKCYVCRSDTDVNCTSENMSPIHSIDCPPKNGSDAILCRKIHQELVFRGEEDFTSIRECGYIKGHLKCYFYKHVEIALQETCECTEDNCNRGDVCQLSDVMIVITFVFVTARFLMNIV